MAFDVRINGEHAKIVLSGDVDLQTTSDLKAEVTKIVGVSHLEIDASSVTYIDSSGVAVLLLMRQHCLQNNISLTLPLISLAVSRVLEIAKIDRILPIGQIVDAATGATPAGIVDQAASMASTDVAPPVGTEALVATADDDLVSELLADEAAPAPAAPSAPSGAEPTSSPSGTGDSGMFKPGSFS
jgi:anti-sigma B factor antagonist